MYRKMYLEGDENNPPEIVRAFHLLKRYQKYYFILRNTWTGIGPRRKKLQRICARTKLQFFHNLEKCGKSWVIGDWPMDKRKNTIIIWGEPSVQE